MAEQYSGVTWTVAELLADVRAEARIANDADITDAEILNIASQSIWSELQSPLLLGLGESGLGIRTLDVLLSAALGSDTNEYVLPSHCSAETISHVHYYETLTATTFHKLENLPLHMRSDYQFDSGDRDVSDYWSFKDGRLQLLPSPNTSATGYLRIFYQRRHPKLLVSLNNTDTVDVIAPTTITVTNANPSNWPGVGGATEYDIAVDVYSSFAPHRYYATDVIVTDDPTAVTLTYTPQINVSHTAEIPPVAAAKVALAGTSDVVHLPPELRRPLTLRTASHILRTIGDEVRANSMLGEYRGMMAIIQDGLMPRAKNANQRVINQNSPLRSGRRRRRFW